jgi:hypothetical protein
VPESSNELALVRRSADDLGHAQSAGAINNNTSSAEGASRRTGLRKVDSQNIVCGNKKPGLFGSGWMMY